MDSTTLNMMTTCSGSTTTQRSLSGELELGTCEGIPVKMRLLKWLCVHKKLINSYWMTLSRTIKLYRLPTSTVTQTVAELVDEDEDGDEDGVDHSLLLKTYLLVCSLY